MKSERSKSKGKSAKGGNADTVSKKSRVSKKAASGVLSNKGGDDNQSVKKSVQGDDQADKRSVASAKKSEAQQPEAIRSQTSKIEEIAAANAAAANEEAKEGSQPEAGEDADIVDDDDLDEIAPQTTKGAHLNSELDQSELNKSMRTQKIPANDEDQRLLDGGEVQQLVKQNTQVEDGPGTDKQKKEKSVLDDIANLGIFSENELEPKKQEGVVIPEIHVTNLQNSWNMIMETKGINPERFGVVLFKNIFKLNPEGQKTFHPKLQGLSGDALYKDQFFLDHAKSVANTIGVAVQNCRDFQGTLIPVLNELGYKHYEKGVKPEDYPYVGEALINTFKAGLRSNFTSNMEESWRYFYKLVAEHMQYEWYTNPELQGNELTEKRIKLVQKSFNMCKEAGIQNVGDALFKEIFKQAPQALGLFSFGHLENYEESDQYINHVIKVASTVGKAVDNLENLDELLPILKALGKDHIPKGVAKEHYPVVAGALLTVVKENNGSEYTPAVHIAWKIVLNAVAEGMISDNYEQIEDDKNYEYMNSVMESNRPIDKQATSRTMQESQRYSEVDAENTIRNEDTLRPMNLGDQDNGYDVQNVDGDDGEFSNQISGITRGMSQANFQTHYAALFRKEVDFHHKIAYRFEKAYRLGKKMTQKRQELNIDIIDCLSDHSAYMEQDPMAIFYCLFFCIYYNNKELVDFLKSIIEKMPSIAKIDKLLKFIEEHDIEKIRTVGEQINSLVYHMVFYQAIDDDLRIVYSQILRQLRFIQMRDVDAMHLLAKRDYELISLTFKKQSTKINLTNFFDKSFPMKCTTYRKYNQAYYEEIIITSKDPLTNEDLVEARVAQNYREKFLVTAEDIFIVFMMYCKEDYVGPFTQTKKDEITHDQFIELFIHCIKNDSFNIGLLIYVLYINPAVDINEKLMEILMTAIKESPLYHEAKLFILHEHFDVLTIQQMNNLIDIYQDLCHHKEPKMNPLVNQFNCIKIALLIFRICWKIEKKQIYSLITKCQLLQNYLIKSLCKYFELQNNILTLHKFMMEPILHMTERKDCLDVMYEMNMQQLLQHPVVVEVLNLVYEGKYSVSSSSLSMSQTFQCLLEMDSFSLKSINERLISNVVNFGDSGSSKQTSLQFNIWKQSIQQREQDEMVFTTIISLLLIFIGILINLNLNSSYEEMRSVYGSNFGVQTALLINSEDDVKEGFCNVFVPGLQQMYKILEYFMYLVILNTIGMFTSFIQKIIVYRTKDNVTLNVSLVVLEASITVVGGLFIFTFASDLNNTLISDQCSPFINLDATQKIHVDKVYGLLNPLPNQLDFKLIISVLIIQLCTISIIMLQRTQYLGELIMMLNQMMNELLRFFSTFGLIIGLFLLLGRMLSSELKFQHVSFFEAFLDLFNAFNGNISFDQFTIPIGQVYIGIFMFLFKILFMSLLAAMFINRYKIVYKNIDAFRRFLIIKQKNSVSYDKFIGGVTITFFPINLIMLPLATPIIMFRSKRASELLLKLQYVIMILLYCFLAFLMIIPASPILLAKIYTNAFFILLTNKRENYKGENVIQFVVAIFLSPIVIVISILIDLFSLPNILLKSSAQFEHKYQPSQDRLNDVQIEVVMRTFGKIFYSQLWHSVYKGSHMTLIELMMHHRKIFSLIDNLHELICRGNLTDKQALSKVQDYNMTKILTTQCSIPDLSGDYKEGRCDLNTIFAVQTDIDLYNYSDSLLKKLRMGLLAEEMKEAVVKANQSSDDKKEGKGEEAKKEEEIDEDDDELKKVDGIFPIGIGPDGAPLKRNNSDVMNNFFINYTVRAFTNIEELMQKNNTQDQRKLQRFNEEVEKRKQIWENETLEAFNGQLDSYENFVKRKISKQKTISDAGSGKQRSQTGSHKKKTESTNSNEAEYELNRGITSKSNL